LAGFGNRRAVAPALDPSRLILRDELSPVVSNASAEPEIRSATG
jgi:hypothetical protein